MFRERDDPHAAYVVEGGLVRVDRTLSSGRTVLLTLITPGNMVGELSLIDGSPRSATAVAVTASELLVVPAARFEALLNDDPEFARVMLGRVTRRLRGLSDQFVETAAYAASTRVAARLVELLRLTTPESDEPIEFRLPITQEELAQWAGLSREGAVKGISELRSAGIIETGRKRMIVLDQDALRRVAQQDELPR